MRTAQETFVSLWMDYNKKVSERKKLFLSEEQEELIIPAMKQYAKEAIEECAKRARIVRYQSNPFQSMESVLANQAEFIDMNSILDLIKELK